MGKKRNKQMGLWISGMFVCVMIMASPVFAEQAKPDAQNLAAGKPYKYEFEPVRKGRDGKEFSLDPGNRKLTNRALPRSWTMKAGHVLTKGWITLDMGKSKPVRTVMVYCASFPGIGIKYPRKIEVEYSAAADGPFKAFGATTDHLPDRRYETAGWMRVVREKAVSARFIRIKTISGCHGGSTGYSYLGEMEVYADLPPIQPRGLYRFTGKKISPLWYHVDQAIDRVGFAIADAKAAGKEVAAYKKRFAQLKEEFHRRMKSITGRTTEKEFLKIQNGISQKAQTLETEVAALTGTVRQPMLNPQRLVAKGFIRMHGGISSVRSGDRAGTVALYLRHGMANMIKCNLTRDIDLDRPISKERMESIRSLKEASLREGLPFFVMFWYNDKRTTKLPWGAPGHLEAYKRVMDYYLEVFGDHPGFAGIYFDEMFGGGAGDNEYVLARLHKRLRRYSPDVLKAHGIEDVSAVKQPKVPKNLKLSEKQLAAFSPAEKFLWMEFLEAEGDLFHGEMDEICRHVRAKRPGTKMYILLTPANMGGDPIGGASFARMGRIADVLGTDIYSGSFHGKAFVCALIDSTATARTVFTPGAHYGNSRAGFNRDLVLAMMHNDGVWPFTFDSVFKHPGSAFLRNRTPAGLWDDCCRIYKKMARLEPSLVNTAYETPIGLVYSERTAATTHYGAGFYGRSSHYIAGNKSLYQALGERHIPAEPFFIQLATPEFLRKYKVLIMQDARSMTDKEIKVIDDWVRGGGSLIATASGTIKDRWGILRKDYALAEMFGVSFVKGPITHRTLKVSGESPLLPGLQSGRQFKMGESVCDLVKPNGGKVLAVWEDGSPAVVSNRYGKGRVIFISACRPFNSKQKDSTDFLQSCVSGALKSAGAKIPFELTGASGKVYAVVRRRGARRVLHMVNLGSGKCAGIKARVPAPKAGRVTLQPDGTQIPFRRAGDYLEFNVPEFKLHTAIVLEPLAK